MTLNVTTAAIASGANTAIAQPSLAQWDQGQILKIEGVELPESYQVEFSGGGTVRTVPMIGTAEGVQIPNKLLQSSHPITAHVVLHESATDRETEYWITIYVKPRQAPETVEIDPADISIIDQTIAAAQQAVATSTAQAEAAAGSAEDAAASAEAAEASAQAAAGSASAAASSERSAGASAVEAGQAQTAAETAQAAAEAAQAAAEQAVTGAQAAGSQAVEAIDEAKTAGIQAIDAEAATQINQVGRAGATQIRQINELASNQMRSIETKTTQSIDAIEDARDAAIEDVQTEGQTQTAAAQAQAQAAASSASAAANSASAAAGSASAAATARTGAETAAASVSASAAQIAQNASDITDLNRQISDVKSAITQETGRNLFNVEEAVDGYIDSSGNIAVYGDWKTTGFIPVSGLKSIIASSVTGTSGNRSFNQLYFLNTYKTDKTRIGKVWDSCTNGKYTIGENVGYIRFSYHNYDWDVNLMVESGEIFHRYRPYEKFNAFNNSPYLDEKELVKDKEELDVVCWGDSLTFSQYSTNTTYPQKLSELITKTNRVHNFGVPGETSLAVATRQGAYPFNMPPCTIPASGYVVVTPSDVFGNEFATLFHNAMRDGQLDLPSPLTVNGKSYGVGYEGNNQYRIANIGTGNEEMTLPHGAVAKMFGELYRSSIPVFWTGTNDSPTTADDAEHITKIIRSMANHSNRDEYLVLGLTVKSYADTVNASLAYEFGQHYVDVKSYLINYGLDINNLTPTEQDTTDIANGVVPTSLRYDSVHFNDYGYIAVATCVYEAGKDLGYWE